MPTLIAEKTVKLEFEDLAKRVSLLTRPKTPPTRTPGVHLSGVLAYIAQKIGVLKLGERDEYEFPLLWGLGQAWEEYAASFYPDMDWQPGELTLDGVSMTADGLSLDLDSEFDGVPWEPVQVILEEFKFTFKAEVDGDTFIKDPRFWMWRMQAAGYCHGYGPRVARFRVCHVRGDYKTAIMPVYKEYILRYSDREVAQAWMMVQSHKHLAAAEKGAA